MLETFMAEYARQLEKAVRDHPEEYGFPASHVPVVVGKMREAFIRGSYNKDGRAIKATCKALGVAYTYAGINKFIRDEDTNAL